MLAAPAAELAQFQPVGLRLTVLGRRIIPLFAITALHGNDLSGHRKTAPCFLLLASSLNTNQKLCHSEPLERRGTLLFALSHHRAALLTAEG
jgi:hypothetical protein